MYSSNMIQVNYNLVPKVNRVDMTGDAAIVYRSLRSRRRTFYTPRFDLTMLLVRHVTTIKSSDSTIAAAAAVVVVVVTGTMTVVRGDAFYYLFHFAYTR